MKKMRPSTSRAKKIAQLQVRFLFILVRVCPQAIFAKKASHYCTLISSVKPQCPLCLSGE